ncbi:hypothetical protein [Microcoleus sp. ARI1-A2]|uniref:hypothetical protein n=1 Tax=Microcoleus sp. ARI1-A2 TaxID=2818557 RepID=UPI002FD07973
MSTVNLESCQPVNLSTVTGQLSQVNCQLNEILPPAQDCSLADRRSRQNLNFVIR